VGFLPVFFSPERCLRHAPIHAQPFPVDGFQTIVFQQAFFPEFKEDTGAQPRLEAVMSSGPRAELGGIQRLPLATSPQDEEDGVHANTVRNARPATAKTMRVLVHRQQKFDFEPEFVRNPPGIGSGRSIHDAGLHAFSCQKQNCSCIIAL
jgi:hypothetical protein